MILTFYTLVMIVGQVLTMMMSNQLLDLDLDLVPCQVKLSLDLALL